MRDCGCSSTNFRFTTLAWDEPWTYVVSLLCKKLCLQIGKKQPHRSPGRTKNLSVPLPIITSRNAKLDAHHVLVTPSKRDATPSKRAQKMRSQNRFTRGFGHFRTHHCSRNTFYFLHLQEKSLRPPFPLCRDIFAFVSLLSGESNLSTSRFQIYFFASDKLAAGVGFRYLSHHASHRS
jgi:hypothetical protein